MSDIRKPGLVSVITIFLDADAFLAEAVRSVLGQSSGSWELILVDDGSTDGSTDTARAFAARHPGRIRYVDHAGHANLGMSAARNAGIAAARGEFIAFLDADDTWLPHKLERQTSLLAEHPGAGLVVGPTLWWQSWTGRAGDARRDFVTTPLASPHRVHGGRQVLERILTQRSDPIYTCSVLLRHDVVTAVGGFEPRFRGLFEDQAFFAKVLLEHDVYVTDECHDRYRQRPDSSCGAAAGDDAFISPSMLAARSDYLQWLASYLEGRGADRRIRRVVAREIRLTGTPALLRTRYRLRTAHETVVGRGTTLAFAAARMILPASARRRLWELFNGRSTGRRSDSGADERLGPLMLHWGVNDFRLEEDLGESSAVSRRLNVRGKRLVLRDVRCSRAYLDFQVSVLRHLEASNFPYEVPRILHTLAGEPYVAAGDGLWLLYRFIEGEDDAEPAGPADAAAIGRLVAHYSRAVSTHDLTPIASEFRLRLFDHDAPSAVLRDLAGGGPGRGALARLVARELPAIEAALTRIAPADVEATRQLPVTAVYNDWHQYNRVVRGGEIVGMVDFDSIVQGPRIVDFQNALAFILASGTSPDLKLAEAFAAAYCRVLPLTALELSLVRPVMVDRLFWIVADVAAEIMRSGGSERESLAVSFAQLLLWLGESGASLEAALQRSSDGVAAASHRT